MEQVLTNSKAYLRGIVVISVAIPVVVALLLFMPYNFSAAGADWVKVLPGLNAVINSMTAILLIMAVVAVKNGKQVLHRNLMMTALVLGTIFLVSYVIYHASSTSVIFGDVDHNGTLDAAESDAVGAWRGIYLFTLLSHIGLSIAVVPFVLLAFYRALTGQFAGHKKIVKFTFPIWLYVSITGVLVYLMISPYYI